MSINKTITRENLAYGLSIAALIATVIWVYVHLPTNLDWDIRSGTREERTEALKRRLPENSEDAVNEMSDLGFGPYTNTLCHVYTITENGITGSIYNERGLEEVAHTMGVTEIHRFWRDIPAIVPGADGGRAWATLGKTPEGTVKVIADSAQSNKLWAIFGLNW